MKNLIKSSIANLSKWLSSIQVFLKKSIFWYPLILSLLSASIYYYFFTVIPQQKALNKIKPQIEYLSDNILRDGMFIVTEMTHRNISQNQYYDGVLTVNEIEKALEGNFFDTSLSYACIKKNGEQYNIGEFVTEHLSFISSNIDLLLRYIIYLDPEQIKLINELQRNLLFRVWNNAYSDVGIKLDGKIYKPVRRDLSLYKIAVFEFYTTLQKLELYVDQNCYSKLKSLQTKAERAYFSQKYKLAIKYNQKILDINKNNKEAQFYLGASLINDQQIIKGVEILKNTLKLYPDQEQFIKSNIANDYAKRKIFEDSK